MVYPVGSIFWACRLINLSWNEMQNNYRECIRDAEIPCLWSAGIFAVHSIFVLYEEIWHIRIYQIPNRVDLKLGCQREKNILLSSCCFFFFLILHVFNFKFSTSFSLTYQFTIFVRVLKRKISIFPGSENYILPLYLIVFWILCISAVYGRYSAHSYNTPRAPFAATVAQSVYYP